MPFATLDFLQFFCQWDYMIRRQFNLSFLKQEIKNPISFGGIKSKFLWFFLAKRFKSLDILIRNPLHKMTQTFKLLRSIFIFEMWQQSLKGQIS